jgi:predicted neuraminidase
MPLIKVNQQFLLEPDHHWFNNCHASTLVTMSDRELLVAYFAGQKEGSGDTAIWLSRRIDGKWLAPVRAIAEPGVAHWNPVLHAQDGLLWLFYKVGADVHQWTTRYVTSNDGGHRWSEPKPLVKGDSAPRGPVKNKLLLMSNGDWLAAGSTEDDRYWDAFVDISADRGLSWQRAAVPIVHAQSADAQESAVWQGLKNDALWETDLQRVFQWDGVIQPTMWESAPGQIHMLMRSTRGHVYRSDSVDYGRSWLPAYATTLPNNNSGIDIVRLNDGTLVLAYNPIAGNWGRRYPISLTYSRDNGLSWSPPFDLDAGEGEFSYPAIIATDLTLYLTYTWNRKNIVYHTVTLSY